MSWKPVAYKDVQDASRSRTIWLVFALLLVSFVGFGVLDSRINDATYADFIDGMAGILGMVLPVIALLLGYKSIAHERINGSIVLTLSFPHSRRDLVVGKFLGRSVVLLLPVLVALLVAGLVGVVLYDSTTTALWYPWFLVVTAMYGLAFLAVAVGLSMSTTVDRRVTLGAFGAYLLFVAFWENLVTATVLVLYRFDFEILFDLPSWAYLAHLLQPTAAYYRLLSVGFDVDGANRYLQPDAPWFVDWWVALLVLLAWTTIPMALGFRRFEDDDL